MNMTDTQMRTASEIIGRLCALHGINPDTLWYHSHAEKRGALAICNLKRQCMAMLRHHGAFTCHQVGSIFSRTSSAVAHSGVRHLRLMQADPHYRALYVLALNGLKPEEPRC
jgi:hypothetical protein